MVAAQIIILSRIRSSSCLRHIFVCVPWKFSTRVRSSWHKFPFHQFSASSSQTKNFDPITHPQKESEWQKKSPPTPKNPFRLPPPPRKIHLRSAAAPYCLGKKRARAREGAYRVSKKCQLWVAEFAGKRGARKRDTRAESEIGGEFEPDECISLDRWVLCGGRASIFCECTSSIGAVNEIDGRPEKWLARSLAPMPEDARTGARRQQTHMQNPSGGPLNYNRTHTQAASLSPSLTLAPAAWPFRLRHSGKINCCCRANYTHMRRVLVKLGPHCSKIQLHQYTQ